MTHSFLSVIARYSFLVVFMFACAGTPAFAAQTATPASSITSKSDEAIAQDDINQFVDTIETIKKNYAKTINDRKLLENAIRGMVNNLDPHSEYLDEGAYKALLTATNGEFGGLGIEVSTQYGVLKVVSPIDNTPAAKAGIKAGDFIVALDGKLVNEMSADQAVEAMRGKEGTPIALTIIRPGEKEPLKFNLTRAIIHIESLKSRMLDDNYGYIRITQFQEPTASKLTKAIEDLKKQAGGQLKGLVLDLRNNPGGLLDSAVDVVNVFLNSAKLTQYKKMIVYTEGRVPGAQFKAYATGKDLIDNAPLLVLINEGSASASEIVAGALQDYGRALIVGNTSFGKGSVQTVLPLDRTHAVKITTALYHTPAGRVIQNQGIIPDVYIANVKVASKDELNIDPVREFQLKDHLMGKIDAPQFGDNKALSKLAQDDFQLYESLTILKAMALKPKS